MVYKGDGGSMACPRRGKRVLARNMERARDNREIRDIQWVECIQIQSGGRSNE